MEWKMTADISMEGTSAEWVSAGSDNPERYGMLLSPEKNIYCGW